MRDKVVRHSYCDRCGIYLFYEHEDQCRVNLGCVEGVDPPALATVYFDGKNLI